ncbi:MAG: UDP-N-acetylmuramoyl-L-alanine--D-glutamate ligase [Candidatus Cloacimonetes bacterium]|nr:UDP-N-acetylmuramoyl-L-alanine--D-glutamate ligase [Candidatus Cloacimonadota bacterium]
MKVKGIKFGILGMGRSGLSVAAKIKELGGIPFLSDNNSEDKIPDADKIKMTFRTEFGGHTQKLLENDILILSPGIPGKIRILQDAKKMNCRMISEIEFSFLIKQNKSKIIAVTGSNGKSTTVSLIHHILKEAGFNAVLAGNIGIPLSSYPLEKAGIDIIVLELSSFQLELIDKFKADVAALINITPDHLNRYNSFADYAAMKFNIFNNQTENDLAILNYDDMNTKKYNEIANRKIKYFSLNSETDIYYKNNFIIINGRKYSLQNTSLKGPHNIANVMCSILAISPFKVDARIIQNSIDTFTPLPHRLEFVSEISGVKFYNDSKATNTDSVKYALSSFDKPLRIILGGAGKNEDYSVLIPYLINNAKKVYLTGDTIDEMAAAFIGKIKFDVIEDFESVIKKAFSDSEQGDIILLSPACTSYDRFDNFEERGNTFKQIVMGLKR